MFGDSKEAEEENEGHSDVGLTEIVRQHYYRYLSKQLEANVNAWCKTPGQRAKLLRCVSDCAEMLEKQAILAAVVTLRYQRAMVKTIANVRRNTSDQQLEESLLQLLTGERPNWHGGYQQRQDQATQTADERFASFGHKQEHADKETNMPRPIRHKWQRNNQAAKTLPNTFALHDVRELNLEDESDDDLAKQLAEIFEEEHTELDVIFGINRDAAPDDPQISSILKEIEEAGEPPTTPTVDAVAAAAAPSPADTATPQPFASTPPRTIATKATLQTNKLRHSLWPCELFMQRRCLTTTLRRRCGTIAGDLRWAEQLKCRYRTLFGDDSDDEFAVYSPSTELDDVLLGSCIKRISHLVVQHLMRPLSDGLIANRYLFKHLARRLAHSIIMSNQYPDEQFIERAVAHYFCLHRAVTGLEDIQDMQI